MFYKTVWNNGQNILIKNREYKCVKNNLLYMYICRVLLLFCKKMTRGRETE